MSVADPLNSDNCFYPVNYLTSSLYLHQNDFDTGRQEIFSHIALGNPDFFLSERMSVRESAVRDKPTTAP